MDGTVKMFIAGVVIGALLMYAWYYFKDSEKFHEEKEKTAPEPPKETPQLVLFYSNGCGHCHRLMPIWEKVEEALKDSPVRASKIEMGQPEAAGHEVKGVPAIRMFPRGISQGFIEYSPQVQGVKGDRSLEDIMRFSAITSSA
jgi:thiol-disulfide isomerase/thioredoxin